VDQIAQECAASIDRRRTDDDDLGRYVWRIGPEWTAAANVQRSDGARRLRQVHHTVDNERRRLDDAGPLDLIRPRELERRDVLRVDLIERRVAMGLVRTGVGQPVLRIALRLQEAFVRYLGADRGD